MTIHRVGLERGRNTLPQLAARAHAGQASLLTKHGKPYAAIVAPQELSKRRSRRSLLSLRGSGKGLWGDAPAAAIAALRDEWA